MATAATTPWTLTDQAHWLIQHEPNAAKRELLLQMLPVNTCTQVTALKRLLSSHGSRFYKQVSRGFGETGFNPIDALQRDYRLQDDWYFFSGIVKTLAAGTATPRTYGFTVMFFADPIGGDRHDAVDYACETAMLLFTDVTNSKVFQSPIEKAVASSILTRRAPFLFQHPTGNFGVASGNSENSTATPNPIFPLLLTAKDTANDITLQLILTPKFDETKPLFQGTADGFVGGAGMGYRYYSYPALSTTGTVTYGPGRTSTLTPAPAEPVTGVTWMDHQNGTVGRIPNLLPWRLLAVDLPQLLKPARVTNIGWNWFAIMLDNSMSLATSFPRNVDTKTGQEILLTDPQPASYVSLQLPDGSSRPLKGKLTIQVQYGGNGSYVTAAHFVGNDAELGDIDLVSQSLLPGIPSAGWLPPMIPFAETPAAVTGSVGGVLRNGFGMLESVGTTDRYHLFANILQLGGLPATPQTVETLVVADFRTAQREGWMVVIGVAVFIVVVVWFVKSRRRGVSGTVAVGSL